MNSDFIIYVDESGDHSLSSVDPDYPVFVLSFCVFRIANYVTTIAPAMRRLKFDLFGHDMVVFHESELRRKRGAFSAISKELREGLMLSLSQVITDADFEIVAVVIDKERLKGKYSNPAHPYHLAFEFGLERLCRLIKGHGQGDRTTHIVCEARGPKEDAELELEFRRIRDGANFFKSRMPFELVMADKKTNSEGLQLADLTARPIGLSVLRKGQANRAYDVLEPKFYRDKTGQKHGMGLKVFP